MVSAVQQLNTSNAVQDPANIQLATEQQSADGDTVSGLQPASNKAVLPGTGVLTQRPGDVLQRRPSDLLATRTLTAQESTHNKQPQLVAQLPRVYTGPIPPIPKTRPQHPVECATAGAAIGLSVYGGRRVQQGINMAERGFSAATRFERAANGVVHPQAIAGARQAAASQRAQGMRGVQETAAGIGTTAGAAATGTWAGSRTQGNACTPVPSEAAEKLYGNPRR